MNPNPLVFYVQADSEAIKVLEYHGGHNDNNLSGDEPNMIYYFNDIDDRAIIKKCSVDSDTAKLIYTLEVNNLAKEISISYTLIEMELEREKNNDEDGWDDDDTEITITRGYKDCPFYKEFISKAKYDSSSMEDDDKGEEVLDDDQDQDESEYTEEDIMSEVEYLLSREGYTPDENAVRFFAKLWGYFSQNG